MAEQLRDFWHIRALNFVVIYDSECTSPLVALEWFLFSGAGMAKW